jgi:dihydrofolate synthase/folylpolyglutamate synthase
MLASILQEAGLKVGLYTSPHIKDFRERIRINGQMITESAVMYWTEQLKNTAENVEASFFEMTVVMALAYFREQKVDIAIIETGMGGRLDSTNVVTPLMSIITHIAKDHQQFLGETIQQIAGEKAGIIKQNIPVLIGRKQQETADVFNLKAQSLKAPLYYSDEISEILKFENLQFPAEVSARMGDEILNFSTPLTANYQKENTAIVLSAISILKQNLIFKGKISNRNIEQGIAKVNSNTGFKGRWELLSNHPLTIADVAHNEEGIHEIVKQISLTPHEKLHIIYGTVADKDISNILPKFPKNAILYFTEPSVPRKLAVGTLVQKAAEIGVYGKAFSDANNAMEAAKKNAGMNDLIIVTGSFFVVCDVL